MTLVWSTSARATEYAAEYWGERIPVSNSGHQPGTQWHIGQLPVGWYYWHVEAYNSAGWSGWTDAFTLTIVPNAPTNLRGTPASRSQINLSWDPPGGEKDGYKVYYASGTYIASTPNTSYQVTDLNCNTGYSFYVTAYKGDFESYPSNTVTVTTSACLPFVQVSTGDGEDWWPTLTQSAIGGLVTIWQRSDGLWEKVIGSDGSTLAPSWLVTPVGQHPALLTARDRHLWLVYDHDGDIWYRISIDHGVTWSDEVRVTTDVAQDYDPTITQTADGALWLVWASGRVPGGSTVWFKRSTDNGATWSADTPIPVTPAWLGHPTIAQAPDGRIWVVWFQAYDFQYSVSANNGASWTPPASLGIGGGDPQLRLGSDGKWWFAWTGIYWASGDWRNHLMYRISTDNGTTWSQPQQYTVFNGYNYQVTLAALPDGRMALAWGSNRTGARNIWFGIPGTHADIVVPPSVQSLAHYPAQPDSSTVVSFTAVVSAAVGIREVWLLHSVSGITQTERLMYDDGTQGDVTARDSVYTVLVGPFAKGARVVYQVRATDTVGLGALTPPNRRFEIAPAAPSLRSPGDGSTREEGQNICLEWDAVTGANEYLAEYWGGGTSRNSGWQSGTSWCIGPLPPGSHFWHVKARNSAGESGWSDTWTFTVNPRLSRVTITGPTTGMAQVSYTFTATVSPITATLPVTYVWKTTGQSPITHTGGLSDTVAFAWNITGTQTLTVIATNPGGTVTGTHTIAITPFVFSCSRVTQIPQVECEALVAFYNSTNGANWTNNSGWLATNAPCSWYGVTCEAGRVTRLSLISNQLSGSIPPQLGNLTSLEWLVLDGNNLSGSIPSELGKLTNLGYLLLSDNQLSGNIPPGLGNLTSLRVLYLQINQLSGSIPREFGNLFHLRELGLYSNQLSGGIPPELGDLSNLYWLALSSNRLSGSIPLELGSLTALGQLSLSDNRLNGSIPPELGNLANLTMLSLSGNQLSGSIPPQLGNLANLQELYLHSNPLSGALPQSLVNLHLTLFWFNDTNLCEPASLQPWLAGIPDLRRTGVICLATVTIAGPSTGMAQMSHTFTATVSPITVTLPITYVWKAAGQSPVTHTGGLSDTVAFAWNITGTQTLTVTATNPGGTVTGTYTITITPFVFSCSRVTQIPQAECQALVALYNSTNGAGWRNNTNWLATNIPCSWYGVTCEAGHVTGLSLNSNQLSGNIPSQLGNLTSLKWLDLGRNQLSGSIPPQLGNLANLELLVLHNNQLSGSIPPQLGNLANLEELYLDSNRLSGSIPPQLGNLAKLDSLHVYSNTLSGSIPPELGNLASLGWLDLSNNQLSGSIPPQLGNLASLWWLDLSNNKLSGSIPLQLGNLASLGFLFLHNNQLSGGIPPQLGNLARLELLDLSSNQLSGGIPPQLDNLANLVQLYLSGNPLSGALPQSLTNLNLGVFWFNDTNLCEPADAAFQNWLASIPDLRRTDIRCVDLALNPPATTVSTGQIFTITMDAAAGTQPVDTVDTAVGFDPNILRVEAVIPGLALPITLTNTVDNVSGRIEYSAGVLSGPPATGNFNIATIRFKAVATGTAQVQFLPGTDLFWQGNSVLGSTHNSTVTVRPAALRGRVALQGRGFPPSDRWLNFPLTVTLNVEDCAHPITTYTTSIDASGIFTITGAAPGTYYVRIKNPHTLSNCRPSVTLPTTETVYLGTLLEGDANDDDCVSGADFSILRTVYGTCPVDLWGKRADFNGDGCVTGADFSLLRTNYGRCGPIMVPPATVLSLQIPAGRVDLGIVPMTNTVNAGQVFTLALTVFAQGQPVDTVDTQVTFDPRYLQVVDGNGTATTTVEPGTALGTVLLNLVDNTTGVIRYSAGQLEGSLPDGEFVLATVRFKLVALPPGETAVAFVAGTDAFFQGESVLGELYAARIYGSGSVQRRIYFPLYLRR